MDLRSEGKSWPPTPIEKFVLTSGLRIASDISFLDKVVMSNSFLRLILQFEVNKRSNVVLKVMSQTLQWETVLLHVVNRFL